MHSAKGQHRLVFTIMAFYIMLIFVLTTLGVGLSGAEDLLEFPDFPEIPNPIEGVPVLQQVLGFFLLFLDFAIWVGLILGYLFTMIQFTFVQFVGTTLSTIIFLPLALILIYELANFVRGR